MPRLNEPRSYAGTAQPRTWLHAALRSAFVRVHKGNPPSGGESEAVDLIRSRSVRPLGRRLARRIAVAILAGAALVALVPAPASAYQPPGRTIRVSVAPDGTEADGHSWAPAMSADGRFVAFEADATTLSSEDADNYKDIFVSDLRTGALELITRSPSGQPANGDSFGPSLSADGRYVAFTSPASNLVSGDTNGVLDAMVHDRLTGDTEVVSLTTVGVAAGVNSGAYSISGDGRRIAFFSFAANVVAGDTNNLPDIFVRDREAGTTERVDVATDGTQANAFASQAKISTDGRFVVFDSGASTLVPGDTNNGAADVFVRDLDLDRTERVSVATDGTEGNSSSQFGAISADGRYVSYRSFSSNLVPNQEVATGHVYLRDRQLGTTERIDVTSAGEEAASVSNDTAISADGRYVAFYSFAKNVVPDDTTDGPDLFVRDRVTGATERISVGESGGSDSWSTTPSMSADGRYVAFRSAGSNLVLGDTNDVWDIFVRDRGVPGASVSARPVAGGVAVDGWVRLSGEITSGATDATGETTESAKLGADIASAALVYRPEDEDVLARIVPTEIPSVRGSFAAPAVGAAPAAAGVPSVTYVLRFRAGGVDYEARATRLSGDPAKGRAPRFWLARCSPACTDVRELSGSLGSTAEEILLSIPLSAVPGVSDGFSSVEARTYISEPTGNARRQLDDVALPSTGPLSYSVRLGHGAADGSAIAWETGIESLHGRLYAMLNGDPDEAVWVESCVLARCRLDTTFVT